MLFATTFFKHFFISYISYRYSIFFYKKFKKWQLRQDLTSFFFKCTVLCCNKILKWLANYSINLTALGCTTRAAHIGIVIITYLQPSSADMA